MSLVQIENLKRVYKTSVGIFKRKTKEIVALDGIDLSIAHGELFGLLGPNGAGKTTVTKILSTILLPTSGSIKIFGLDVVKDAKSIRPRIGIVFGGDRGLYWRLSAVDNLQYFADLYHLDPQISKGRIPELLDFFPIPLPSLFIYDMRNGKHVHEGKRAVMRLPVVIGAAYVVAAVDKRGPVEELESAAHTDFEAAS